MSLDLTGIENINEFYTDHYLATYFEESVKSAVRAWKDAHEAEGAPVPWRELKSTAGKFYQVHERASRATQSERAEARAEMVTLYLKALGYAEPAWVDVDTRSGLVYPAFAEYADASGRPLVQVYLSAQQSPDDDMMEVGLAVPAESECGNHVDEPAEDMIDGLFFDTMEPARFIILADAFTVMLFDRNKWQEKRCIRFDMEELFRRREDTTFQAMSALLAATSLAPEVGTSLLDDLDAESRKNAASVSESLKYALRECIELLGNEVIYDWVHNKGGTIDDPEMDEGELTIECLRYMYRMLFLLFMEARPELGFAPMKSEAYLKSYSLESLREIAEALREDIDTVNSETNYIDQTMEMICKLVYDGYPYDDETFRALAENESVHDAFLVPPLKAHIFDAERTRLISNARLRDCVMVKLIDRMSITEARSGHRRERISYGTLGINQLGSVYEALLSYRGFIARQDLYEVKKRGDSFDPLDVGYFVPESALGDYDEDERVRYESGPHAGELRVYRKGEFVYRLAGREREKSASFYTPESLTHCLVKYALKELLEGKTADEILGLTICEPAMGSAAFLNEAINQLAEAYLAKRQEETGNEIPYDERALELQRVKMYIADRNVYGIDLNPIAVELGEVSLWLNTISQDGYVPWFGNQLHNGNSLIGAHRRAYTEKALKSRSAGIRWYDREPERVGYETGCSKSHRIYHFLVGDPGMSNYKDKVVKDLEPEAIRKITAWNRAFTKSYDDNEIKSLRKLSYTIDELWRQQIEQQRQLRRETQDSLDVFGVDLDVHGSHTTIREKDAVLAEYYRSEHARNAGPYARLKFAMDYWCALWFWPIDKADLLPTRDEYLLDMAFILEGVVNTAVGLSKDATLQPHLDLEDEFLTDAQLKLQQLQLSFEDLGTVNLDDLCSKNERLSIAKEIADRNHFFHWELEFADVFESRGGFDLILGNPPWIQLGWNGSSVLADLNPLYHVRRFTAHEIGSLRNRVLQNADARYLYENEYVSIAGQIAFLGARENYYDLIGSDTNLYKRFVLNALRSVSERGCFGLIHPAALYDEVNGSTFRKKLYPRLRKCFRFENELKLFKDIGNTRQFCLSVSTAKCSDTFDYMCNVFTPETIDESYEHNGEGRVPGIKNEQGLWELRGHRKRIINITSDDLMALSNAYDNEDQWEGSRLGVLHSRSMLEVLRAISSYTETSRHGAFYGTTLYSEAAALDEGLFVHEEHFPATPSEWICSGPNVGLSNPWYQCANRECRTHRAYSKPYIDGIAKDYIPRCKYRPCNDEGQYSSAFPATPWGESYADQYRIFMRRMLGQNQDRTLMPSIYPPGVGHFDGILGIASSNLFELALLAGELTSLVFDGFIKISGNSNINFEKIERVPLVSNPAIQQEIVARTAILNSLGIYYSGFWKSIWDPSWRSFEWAMNDARLGKGRFSALSNEWNQNYVNTSDYERRQLLLEIDVLVAMGIGLSLDALEELYRLQFPVLQENDSETWYDTQGDIAYSKKSAGNFKLTRQEFDHIKNDHTGAYEKTFTDDTQPGGPAERMVKYIAPFDKCDRIEDYRTAWAFFEGKYGKQGGDK